VLWLLKTKRCVRSTVSAPPNAAPQTARRKYAYNRERFRGEVPHLPAAPSSSFASTAAAMKAHDPISVELLPLAARNLFNLRSDTNICLSSTRLCGSAREATPALAAVAFPRPKGIRVEESNRLLP